MGKEGRGYMEKKCQRQRKTDAMDTENLRMRGEGGGGLAGKSGKKSRGGKGDQAGFKLLPSPPCR